MTTASLGVRERMAAASKRIARVKRLDRAATAFISFGGLFIILSVLFIFVFIFAEAVPLFRGAKSERLGSFSLASPAGGGAALAFGLDEYQRYLYDVTADGRVLFFRLQDGALHREVPFPGLAGSAVTAASRSLQGDLIAAGTADGRVALAQVRFRPVFEDQRVKDLESEVRDRGTVDVDPQKRPVRDVSYVESAEGEKTVAALVAEQEIVVARVPAPPESESEPAPPPVLETLRTKAGDAVTHVRLGRSGTLVATAASGTLYHWDLGASPAQLTDAIRVAEAPLTAVEWGLGGSTVIVGDEKGAVTAWFRARLRPEADLQLVKAHEFEPQGSAITSIASSVRERSFVTTARDGSVLLRHLTSERTLLRQPGSGKTADAAVVAPRADGILVKRADGMVERYTLENPHPEFSWRAMLGKVWYEGYPEPAYVWQSTGATDDFEPKMSLVPLVFGTIKATFYALVFAIPLAVMGALYTSQFVHPTIKAKVKPTVEIMAALPSVVIGFIAGLWLASRVEAQLVPALLLIVFLPLAGTAGVLFWDRLPYALRRRLKPGMEVVVILPLLLAGGWLAFELGPLVERGFFGNDVKHWLSATLDLVYDQRNSIVVGLAMGFAVIPIIFTISEDAFSSVPQHLTAASLAVGASRWQTAVRVVLPTASPGIFSAVMVGFGRAVGETMIVLMATGNTPVLDWSPFNGMRTLSANIAVEVPEAPHGGTLYRVLFLSACVLFLMTFLVNTVAELVRQRLRDKYKAI
ncbi:MAG: ABC transporter permease subunit [Vicinamibacteria bacterium]